MATRFRMNRQGIGEMLRMPSMEAEMLRRAQRIKQIAEATSPVYERGEEAGRYKSSWETDSTRTGGRRRDRAVAFVRNTSPYARFVEYGTERVPAHHTLLRAAQTGGG